MYIEKEFWLYRLDALVFNMRKVDVTLDGIMEAPDKWSFQS